MAPGLGSVGQWEKAALTIWPVLIGVPSLASRKFNNELYYY